MVLVVVKDEVNTIKEYLKQIEMEAMEMAERLKLDGQVKWGLDNKFKQAYAAIEKLLKPDEEPERPKVAKVDVRTGIKRT